MSGILAGRMIVGKRGETGFGKIWKASCYLPREGNCEYRVYSRRKWVFT